MPTVAFGSTRLLEHESSLTLPLADRRYYAAPLMVVCSSINTRLNEQCLAVRARYPIFGL